MAGQKARSAVFAPDDPASRFTRLAALQISTLLKTWTPGTSLVLGPAEGRTRLPGITIIVIGRGFQPYNAESDLLPNPPPFRGEGPLR